MLKIKLEYAKGILFVRIKGSLNKTTHTKINNELIPVILNNGIKYLVYNLYNLESIDKAGMSSLLLGEKAVSINQGTTCICEIPERLTKRFDDVRCNKVIDELCAVRLFNI